jgi:hypothetical protein
MVAKYVHFVLHKEVKLLLGCRANEPNKNKNSKIHMLAAKMSNLFFYTNFIFEKKIFFIPCHCVSELI